MPELPEVETVVRDLRPRAVGRTVAAVRVGAKKLRTPWDAAWGPGVVGRRVDGLRRRGKWIVVELGAGQPIPPTPPSLGGKGGDARGSLPAPVSGREEGPSRRGKAAKAHATPKPGAAKADVTSPPFPPREGGLGGLGSDLPRLVVHLGMTGQFTAVAATEPEPDHLHLVFAFDDGTELRFRDVRRFGSVTRYPAESAVEAFFAASGLGPEPFGLDAAAFRAVLRGSARCLKAVLLDQTVVAGVGNIYADEACSHAGLHPARRGTSLTPAECERLRDAIEQVLTTAIAARGSTIRDYVDGSGQAGGYQLAHRVYGRTGEPCRTCGRAIECVRLAGRSSHFCPRCQVPGDREQGVKSSGRKAGINSRPT